MRAAEVATVTTLVAVDPIRAFDVFTSEIGQWWKSAPRYRFHPEKSGTMRFEPGVGGRLVEVHDAKTGAGFEVGRVLVWEPGARLVFEFRGRDFAPGECTEVEVRFEAEGKGSSGATVRYLIEGKIENLGSYRRVLAGTWTQGAERGDFRLTRN